MLTLDSDVRAPPEQIKQQILAIAPILPGQKTSSNNQENVAPAHAPAPTAASRAPDMRMPTQGPSVMDAPRTAQPSAHTGSLIDLDSRPTNAAPPRTIPTYTNADPIAGNPFHPTSNPKNIAPIYNGIPSSTPTSNVPYSSNLMDDDRHLSNRMAGMSMHEPLRPRGNGPLRRTDTETSELDTFVDAEG